jgi:hypothetical protein
MPVAVGIGLFFLILVTFVLRLSFWILVTAALQLAVAFLGFSLVGNYVSIVAPYRIAAGSLKPTKTITKTAFFIFILHLLFPLALLPVSLPPVLQLLCSIFGWLPGVPVNVLSALLLLVATALVYRLSLNRLGAMLQQREKEILKAVTQETE